MNFIIKNDVYDIAKRIKYIDDGYFIVYNTTKHNYEVHNSHQIDSTYCLTLPYNTLDERTLTYVSKTQSRYSDELIRNIENENRLMENANISRVLLQFNENLRYLNN